MAPATEADDFPCSLTVNVPFPTSRLARIAMRSLAVDEELSPLVRRSFSVAKPSAASSPPDPALQMNVSPLTGGVLHLGPEHQAQRNAETTTNEQESVLVTEYRATTNRMLRVSVNGFFESLNVVISCMRELDGDDGWQDDWVGNEEEDANGDIKELRKVQGLQETGLISAV